MQNEKRGARGTAERARQNERTDGKMEQCERNRKRNTGAKSGAGMRRKAETAQKASEKTPAAHSAFNRHSAAFGAGGLVWHTTDQKASI